MNNNKPIVGITIGDFNGIGPEIIIKALSKSTFLNLCTPVIYGSVGVISQYLKLLDEHELDYVKLESIRKVNPNKVNILNCWKEDLTIEPGKPTKASGSGAFFAIKDAVIDLKDGEIQALITAPINKHNIHSEDFNFPGHTEYLLDQFESKDGLMILKGEKSTVATITSHIALEDVPTQITKDHIIAKTMSLVGSLKKDFGIEKPKIAVLGLNPHASDNGLFGSEEQSEIIPAIQSLKEKGILAFGPFSSDGIFGSGQFANYDAVLGMYHDQVLTPFKVLEFETGVNFTSGIEGIRTSPDHGTAYDIAGKNKANPRSMQHAIFTALDILKERNLGL